MEDILEESEWGLSTEIISFVLRLGPGHKTFGDPWSISVTAVTFDDTVFLSAMNGWNHKCRRLIVNEIKRMGFRKIVWTRKKAGKTKERELSRMGQ